MLAQIRYILGFGLYVGAGSAIAVAGLVGYQIGLSDNLALDLGARVMYLMQDIETTNSGTTTTTKNNSVNIIPNLGVTYKF